MQQINQDIKNQTFQKIYLLYGEEDYLRIQYRDKLSRAVVPEGDSMNYRYYEGSDVNIPEIIDLAETMPFFAEHRVIVIENSGLFQSGGEKLAEYLSSPAETVIFIFVEVKVDKRSRLYKVIKEKGRITEFTRQNEMTLKRWIASILKSENKIISEKTCSLFLEKTGPDMANIRSELEKLICYSLNEYEITREAVEKVCTRSIANHIFDMVSAIADRKQKVALDLYRDLLSLKEPPMRILSLIVRQYNLMLQVKELQKKGIARPVIGQKVGLPPYIVAKYEVPASRHSFPQLTAALKACLKTDEDIKNGKIEDTLGIELLIIELSR